MKEALQFGIARIFRHEPTFQKYSVPRSEIIAELANRKIAIVGNARALENASFGTAIDAADIVIRINRAPMPTATSHGSKTDWLALATSLPRQELSRIAPRRVLWMSHKRKRLPLSIAQTDGFYLHSLTDKQTLHRTLGNPPSTGVMLIDLAAASEAQSIDLFGFDFFVSKSLSGSREAAQVPHDFNAEKSFVHSLADKDHRIIIHN